MYLSHLLTYDSWLIVVICVVICAVVSYVILIIVIVSVSCVTVIVSLAPFTDVAWLEEFVLLLLLLL